MYLPAAAHMAVAFGVGANEIALSVPSYLAGVLIGQLAHGFASDRYGRKPPLYVGLLIYSVSSFACACVGRVDWFVALRFLQGIGGSVGMVLTRAMIRDRTDTRDAARAFSALMLIASVAPLMAPLLGATLLHMGGWRVIFASMGSFGVILFAVCRALPETLDRSRRDLDTRSPGPHHWREIFRDRQFVACALSSGFLQGGMYAYIAMSAIVFLDEYGLSSGRFGIMIAANSLGMVVAAQINAWLIRRVDLQSIVRWGLWTSVASLMFLAGFAEKPPASVLFAAVFVYLSTIGFVAPNSAAIALARHTDSAGSAAALLGSLLFGIGVASGAIVTHVLPDTPTRALMLVMAACSALATLVFYLGQRKRP
ncbi:MFS transporter [Trinickia dinghuensis]|uniref:Bcr/CflA family efflux transporter n=2 Tax=Trinickia dinghuensis TaxID=2291023 RepID=A0A3D8K4V0_9BURK|nr:MFS transporter [Trinickia dinghuensis]